MRWWSRFQLALLSFSLACLVGACVLETEPASEEVSSSGVGSCSGQVVTFSGGCETGVADGGACYTGREVKCDYCRTLISGMDPSNPSNYEYTLMGCYSISSSACNGSPRC